MFAFLLLPVRCVFSQDGIKVSTVSARQHSEESPLTLNIEKDRYGSRVGLDYSLRWDFSDLKNIRPNVKTLAGGLAAAGKWDITENTKVKYYGFSVNPWRLLLAKEKAGSHGLSRSSIAGESGTPEYKKRLRLSFSPLVDDLKRDLDENLRNLLLESSFSGLSPQWRKVGRQEKKMFFKDVLSLDIWDAPGLGEAKKGIEYIAK